MDDENATPPGPADPGDPAALHPKNLVALDSQRLHALAHPLRLRLLGALRLHGPSTATTLARLLETNSGQTSYHLRQLAEVGLIEDDPDHSTARDRFWRACHDGTSWRSRDFRDDPDDWAADTLLVGQVVRLHGRWLDQMLAARDQWDEEWLASSDLSDYELHLAPDRLRALIDELHAVIRRYISEEEHDRPGAERVTVLLSSFLHPDPAI